MILATLDTTGRSRECKWLHNTEEPSTKRNEAWCSPPESWFITSRTWSYNNDASYQSCACRFLWQPHLPHFRLEINFVFVRLHWPICYFQSEAVINSGPAVFISPSGPNPLMVPVSCLNFSLELLGWKGPYPVYAFANSFLSSLFPFFQDQDLSKWVRCFLVLVRKALFCSQEMLISMSVQVSKA